MNKYFIVLVIVLGFHLRLSAQQFSQYNTGTVYDSFENPSQKSFVPDSSRKVAFNLFAPALSTNLSFSGNAQAALKSRAVLGSYANAALTIGQNNYNYVNADATAYYFMLKIYTNLQGNQELGFFLASKAEGRGVASDESVQIVADNSQFTSTTYNNTFNTKYNYQLYHQLGVSWREDLDDQVSIGIKLSALLGVVGNKVNINRSSITFDRLNDRAFLSTAGDYEASYAPGGFSKHDLLPTTRNPGAQISLGIGYESDDHYKLQFNLKDLGFIHWNNMSQRGEFDNTGIIADLSQPGVEDRIAQTALSLVQTNSTPRSYTSATNSKFEMSGSHSYWLDGYQVKCTPTVILSKELLYPGFTTAFVNHFQYHNFVGTASASYNDLRYFNLGLQLMVKSPNAEFYIGCDRLPQTAAAVSSLLNNASPSTFKNSNYTGLNFFMGFTFKLGPKIEHANNTSLIPMEDHPSFARRFWSRITGNNIDN